MLSKINKKYARWALFFLVIAVLIVALIAFFMQNGNENNVMAPTNLNYHFGISTGGTLPLLSSQDLNRELDDIASLGVGWVRLDLEWSDIQPNSPADFDWTNFDRVVMAAEAHHIKLLPILDFTPRWARNPGCINTNHCAPADPNAFAAFAKAAVKRYSPRGVYVWEIWNEPNFVAFWHPAPSAKDYVALLKPTYAAIKSEDPSAIVLTGGLGPTATQGGNILPAEFLKNVYADGGKNYFDAVAFHPYSFPAMPSYFADWNAWTQMSTYQFSLRNVMIMNGDASKKIWVTEYGAPTGGPGLLETSASDTNFYGHPDHVTEGVQSQMMIDAFSLIRNASWAGPVFWYSYKDLGTNSNTSENFFGIIRYDGIQKPSYNTLKSLISL